MKLKVKKVRYAIVYLTNKGIRTSWDMTSPPILTNEVVDENIKIKSKVKSIEVKIAITIFSHHICSTIFIRK